MPEIASQNDLYQVRLVGRIDGQETNNVLHFKCVSGGGDTDVELHLILVLLNCFITNILPVLTSGFTLERALWKKVSPTLGIENITVPAGGGVGGGPAVALPSFCSALLSIRTAQGGRSKRGRMYIAGIPEAATTNSVLTSPDPFFTALQGFVTCLIGAFIPPTLPGTNSWAMGVYSRKIGGANFPYGAAGFTPMVNIVAVQQIATTRSRKVGRGS